MYSKLWVATNVDYPMLLDRLIGLALDRHRFLGRVQIMVLHAGDLPVRPRQRADADAARPGDRGIEG